MPSPDTDNHAGFLKEALSHKPTLFAWLRARFRSLADTDDIVQEAFARLLRARASGPVTSSKAFLFVTARNLALNQLRHQRIERPPGLAEIAPEGVLDDGASVPDAVAHAEEFQLLIQAIQSLPERCRQVVTLRKIYGLSQQEVAARLGISEHTVEAQGTIGLRKCTEFFRRHGYGPDVRR